MGEILVVMSHIGRPTNGKACAVEPIGDHCYVFKLSPSGQKLELVENLGDQALFLGMNHSFAVSASEFPGIQGNSVYLGHGIFNLKDKYTAYHPIQSMRLEPPAIWVAPSYQIQVLKQPAGSCIF